MRNTLVADTSVVFAAIDPTERHHAACSQLVTSGPAVVLPAPVVTETAGLALRRRNARAVEVLLEGVLDGTVEVADLDHEDYRRTHQLVVQYADLPLSFVDAAVVAIAERLEEDTIATLDHRHFSVIRPAHVKAFTLVP